jgi:aarF domain-containing kinase
MLRRPKLITGAVFVGTIYTLDETKWFKVIRRSVRALGVGMYTIVNYKFLWSPENASVVNSRVATAITNCCLENEGLYVKIGQALNSMSVILPPEYTASLTRLLDKAKTYDFKVIQRILDDELGPGIVGEIDPVPVGSASLAQVHRGKYLPTGEIVAIKVQKPNVSMQAYWDLLMYKLLVRTIEWAFEIPLYWNVDFTTSHFMAELDFRLEAANSDLSREQLKPLGDMVYIPKIIRATPKVLLIEWIDNTVMISNVSALKEKGFDCKSIILDATRIFGYQIFHTGHVHCDPHFGNLLIRPNPQKAGKHQVVLIDHGLYVDLPDQLRRQYAKLWVAMIPPQDRPAIEKICQTWGIGSTDLFEAVIKQSALNRTLLSGKKLEGQQSGTLIKDRVTKLLQDTSKFPNELVLVGRCLNYIRAANWTHGSPVDRVSVLAEAAKDALNEEKASTKGWLVSSFNWIVKLLPTGDSYHKDMTEEVE